MEYQKQQSNTVGGKLYLGQVQAAQLFVLIIEHCLRLSLSPFLSCLSSSSSRSSLILTARIAGLGEHGYKSPSLEVWVSLSIMGGGRVLIAAR